MKKGRYYLAGFLLAATLLFWYARAGSQWTSYHRFEGACLDCHLTVPAPGERQITFKKNVTFMCRRCHRDQLDLAHPVDVKPKMAVPQSLPLDWKGDVTCISCHPAHSEGFGPYRLRVKASGPAFCTLCHSDLEAELHKVSVGTAHVTPSSNVNYAAGELYTTLDELSIKCLSCHDAVFAKDTAVENKALDNGIFHAAMEIGLSHPVGVSYLEARNRYKGAYKPLETIPREVRLFGGNVGCATCHNPYSKQHSELVMSNKGSALCLVCHVK